MTIPQDPQQVPNCQDPTSPYCVTDTTPADVTFVCGGDRQVDQCVLPSQTGQTTTVVAPTPVVAVPTSTPAALALPTTGSPSAPISGLAAVLLIVGVVCARIGRLTSAR